VIHVVTGDLASVMADAVVRPATTHLEPLTPALRQLDAAAGPRFMEQATVRRELPPGAAVVTGAGDLAAEFVVHLVLGAGEDDVTLDNLRRATEAALWQCTQWQIVILALAVPAIGNLAPGSALGAMLAPIRAHLRTADHPTTILICQGDSALSPEELAKHGLG